MIITSSLLKAIPEKIADIAELRASDLKALVNDFGAFGQIEKDILIPQIRYQTNDSWEIIGAGRPLKNGVSGYPILLKSQYSNGYMYVLTIPDDFGNLYDLPADVLNMIRRVASRDLDLRLDAPAKVSLFLYDNDTFIVESFLDQPVTIQLYANENIDQITDILTDAKIEKRTDVQLQRIWHLKPEDKTNVFRITLPPHSYRVFKKN